MTDQFQQLMKNAPAWLTPEMVLIGAGVLAALLLLWLISRLRRRPRVDAPDAAPVYYEEEVPPARPITPPPVMASPLMDEPPFAPPASPVVEAALQPELEPAPEPEPEFTPAPAPIAFEPPSAPAEIIEAEAPEAPQAPAEPVAMPVPEAEPAPEPEPAAPIDEAPEPAPLADEPIAAAAPFDASPASIAADVPEPEPEPEPVIEPEPVHAVAEAAPAPASHDELTRMKGVGPRLADRLNTVGVTSFAQLAAMSPQDADALDARLGEFQGRVHSDRWIEQAGYLASGDIAGFEEKFRKL